MNHSPFCFNCYAWQATQNPIPILPTACGHSGVLLGTVKLLKALPYHYHRQQSYFPSQLSDHGQLDIKNQSQISHDWLVDVSNYGDHHYNLATAAIDKLPEFDLKKNFMINALSRTQLQNILVSRY